MDVSALNHYLLYPKRCSLCFPPSLLQPHLISAENQDYLNPASFASLDGSDNHASSTVGRSYMALSKHTDHFDPNLPEDIVVKILCRLPVKSLIRFTCVSKRWRVIIFDPQFCKSHFQLACEQRTLRQSLFISTHTSLECSIESKMRNEVTWLPSRFQISEDLDRLFSGDNSALKKLTCPLEPKSQPAMASCNGLVFLGDSISSPDKNMAIWNPSTGFCREIPSPDFGFGALDPMVVNYGFGYMSDTDDYKLVFVVPAWGKPCHDVHIFSLRASCWKKIQPAYSPYIDWASRPGSLSNGAMHWADYNNGGWHQAIHAFDLTMEVFRQVPLPVFNENDGDARERGISTLALLRGCLCVWTEEAKDGYYLGNTCWAMTQYGEPESWVKLFQLSQDDLPDFFVPRHFRGAIFSMEDTGTVVIVEFGQKLIWIECKKDQKPVCKGQYRIEKVPGYEFCHTAIVYDETLLSVTE